MAVNAKMSHSDRQQKSPFHTAANNLAPCYKRFVSQRHETRISINFK